MKLFNTLTQTLEDFVPLHDTDGADVCLRRHAL